MKSERDWKTVAARRWRLASLLTVLMVVVYFGFILSIAFAKNAMGTTFVPGLSWGIALGAAVIAAAWALTGIYVYWANKHYDAAIRAVVQAEKH